MSTNDPPDSGEETVLADPEGLLNVLAQAGVGIWEYDLDADRNRWDPRLARLVGYPEGYAPDGLAGWQALIHPDDLAEVQRKVEDCLADPDGGYHAEYRFRLGNGNWGWISAYGQIQCDELGQRRKLIGTMRDVSRFKFDRFLRGLERDLSLAALESSRDPLARALLNAALHLSNLDVGALFWLGKDNTWQFAVEHGFAYGLSLRIDPLIEAIEHVLPANTEAPVCSCQITAAWCTGLDLVHHPALRHEGIQAVTLLPVKVASRTEAVLLLANRHAPQISESALNSLRDLAEHFSRAISRRLDHEAIERKDRQMQAVLQTAQEGILAVLSDGHILLANERFREMWRIPRELIESGDDARVLAFGTDQVSDTAAFLARIRTLWDNREIGNDVIHFQDGRVFERHSRPLEVDGTLARVWSFRDVSEATHARDQLTAEREHLSSLFAALPDLVWLKDPDGRYLDCNPMFELLYGAKKADILGKTDYDFVDRETADFFRANDRHAMEADAPKVNEEWLSFAVGGYRALFETIKTPMRAGDGRLIGVLGVARDISRLHAAQERLREQEEIYRAIVSQAGDGIVLIDTETLGFREFNDAAAEMLGYNREEFARLSLPDLQGKLSPDEVSRAIRDLLEVDGADFEIQHRHKDGSLRDMLTSNRPVTLRGQRYVAAIWRDITEQKQTEAELTTYRESLVALVAQRTEALETANRRLQVSDRRLNAMFEMSQRSGELQERELLQMGIDEAVRLTDSEIGYLHFVDEDAQTIELVTWSHGTLKYCQATYDNHYPIAAAGIWADTVRLHRPVVHNDYQHMRGPHGYPACHAHLVRHLGVPLIEQGKVRMLLGVGNKATDYDATDIRELELIGNDLWRIIMRRRTEIALAEAKDAAEAANRAKSVFLANMSHEIRTPMNAILGLTHLLQRGAQDPRQRDQLDKVSSAAQHLLALINNILDISKIEAGKLNLEHTDINLDRLFAGIFDLLCDKARDKGLEIVQDIDPALPLRLRGDATRLGQVLLNLASNAVKFTDAGTVVLRALPAETAACVRFEVLDTGIGLSEAQIRRLFQPFEQADNSTTRRYGGTGLGLAISHRLVELMGGRTGVESEPGKGSRFWFEVPLPAASAQPEPPAPRAELTGRRVLVVDDLEPVRAGLTRQLTSQGLTVECVDNAEAAMSRITEADAAGAAYWSVFLDQHLPGVDGLAIARQIAATPLARPPLLTLLGDAEAGLRGLDLHASGIKAILRKPVGRAGLHVALAELCDTPPSLPPVAASPAASALQALSAYRDARLLLAEDDPINQEVAVQLLHDAGLAVDVAENGEKALELARAGRYDLVLMDVQMPVMDGLAATGAIHALPGLEKLPVLAMTANVFADDRQSCLAAGMCDHVAKPVDPEQLYAALLRWLPEQARRAPVQAPAATPVAADVALLARLRAIEGLDADAGLKVLRNRLPTYMRLLEQFARDHAGDVARARACLASGDPDEARRLVHSIKGAAATLGAESVRAAALEMEMAIRAGQPETTLAPLAAALEAAQAQLSQALAGLPRPASAMAAAAEVDWPKVRQALSELVGLLEEDDIRASTYYRERETLIAPVLGGRARGIARLIGQFSLDTALVEIREAIRDLPELTR